LRKRKPQKTQALALALKFSRNKRKRQPIGMLGRSSGNHDWLLPTQAIAFEWKPGLTLECTCDRDINVVGAMRNNDDGDDDDSRKIARMTSSLGQDCLCCLCE